MKDYLFRESIQSMDPELDNLLEFENERQYRKLILIPSESSAPVSVRKVLSSSLQNIYAEGYPDEESRLYQENEILDYERQLSHYRRFSDPRYYKGVEYADIVEMLARRRCAELFANNRVSVDDLFVNVQPLSGAPANNAIFHAFLQPGDTILGMSLLHGGHLTHGSSVNRSGKYYKAIHYTIDPQSEKINYDSVASLAKEHKPKLIIAGYSSYPWSVDWKKFKEIAAENGAYLMADIAHVAGLVAAGLYPSPIGYADVISFTTHKSLCGPRGACIITTNPSLSKKIDKAVFPGEQGGPHVNVFAAIALTLKIAATPQFQTLQKQIVENCSAFTNRFEELGFKIPYGGTDTHLMNLDCNSIQGYEGTSLSGDQASRILDIAGIVVNRNTIPGDKSALDPSGIRMGTPWVTQRGFKTADMVVLAEIITNLLMATTPYTLESRKGTQRRAKVNFEILEETKIKIRDLAQNAGIDITCETHGYPHYFYLNDKPVVKNGFAVYAISGERVREFLDYNLSINVAEVQVGESNISTIKPFKSSIDVVLTCVTPYEYKLQVPQEHATLIAIWLRDLSDGYISFGENDINDFSILRRMPGPIIIKDCVDFVPVELSSLPIPQLPDKPYYHGFGLQKTNPLKKFSWMEKESDLRRTPIYDVHRKLGAKIIPFAGWEMPVWYTSVLEEHLATRQTAGLFDVAHMGVYQAEGPNAMLFLDSVCGNDISSLDIGDSCYTHFMDAEANVIDDTLVYRRGVEQYLVVVNASNDDKNWAWLNSVRQGEVLIDVRCPYAKSFARGVILRNLRDPKAGKDMRVDIALQGPKSREILLAMGVDEKTKKSILRLERTQLCEATVGNFNLVVSRTGYTGERMAFELFVHPDQAAELFSTILEVGNPFGVKPIGLGARDSLRTEAGLPLYGHEMGLGSGKWGSPDLGIAEGGFGSYVKPYKPWFIGREAFLTREKNRKGVVARFRFSEKGIRMAHPGDPVLEKRGKVIGWVTSCAVDANGYLTGQAFIETKFSEEGIIIYIYQSASDKISKAPAELNSGDKVVLPTEAVIVSRFPK